MNRSADSVEYTPSLESVSTLTTSRPSGSKPLRYYDWIAHHAGNRPSKEAIRDLAKARHFTYADLDTRADAMAAYFTSIGIGRGDRVAVLAHNGVEYFDMQFACARTGAICVFLNWRLTIPELEYIVNDSAPTLMVHDAAFRDHAEALLLQCGIARSLEIAHGSPDCSYERAIEVSRGKSVERVTLTHDDVVTIMYTSGTTGRPKGAMITHGMNFWNCVNLGIPAGIGPDTVHLNVLPLFHTGGLNCYSNPVLHAGGTVVIQKQFDPGESLRLLGDPDQGITHFFAVPAPYQFMMQHPTFADTDLSRLRIAGVGGAPCPLPLLETWISRGVHLAQGYGMTESSPGALFLEPDEALRKIGSTGKALLHTEFRIVRADGSDCGVEEVGELWIAGPHITPGYWSKPRETADSFDGRWLKTGDAARHDAEGFVYIVDRWKDMYISGGENVYPAEVENVLHELPQVSEAAVIGIPHERWGETGLAVLVLKPDATLDRATVTEHCRTRLARFKVPTDVAFMNALPRNATGKVLKRQLRSQLVGDDVPRIT
jgi:fatty-acyl-CoA synthase